MKIRIFEYTTVPVIIVLLVMISPLPALAQPSVLVPLTDMGEATYQGYSGGLYPDGNMRPVQHGDAGRLMAANIQPLDTLGRPDPVNGKIVLLSIGMSNATQEFSAFMSLARTDTNLPRLNAQLVIVDGAQGGQTAAIIAKDTAQYWRVIDQRLKAAGVTRKQVQAAWVKEADASPTTEFLPYTQTLETELVRVNQILKSFYPNIQIAYQSSRTYGGYATSKLNPEPYAYQSGFAVKWLVERQINGDTALAFDSPNARSPWIAWGPYLWANGTTPRSDGLTWEQTDFGTDGTHPNAQGRAKVAQLLWDFLVSDETAVPWFLAPSTLPLPEPVTLISPADSTTFTYGEIIHLQWEPAQPEVTQYEVQMANNIYFITGFPDTNVVWTYPYTFATDTTLEAGGILRGPIWWRVRAANATGWGPYGNQHYFRTSVKSSSVPDIAINAEQVTLEQNHPNPCSNETTINFALAARDHVSLTVYDALGRHVATLIDKTMEAGSHSVVAEMGNLASGTYVYQLSTSKGMRTRSMVVGN